MREKSNTEFPFKPLGTWMKRTREKNQKSVAEVSGAVEIDSEQLRAYEQGAKRPSEDILMLLISYFAVKEEDAVEIWELAGYTKPGDDDRTEPTDQLDPVQPVIVMPMDARIVYTDMTNIKTTKYGVSINFLQSDGISGKPLAVSRVGMSRDHAEKLLSALAKALQPQPQKLLPAPEESDKPEPKS